MCRYRQNYRHSNVVCYLQLCKTLWSVDIKSKNSDLLSSFSTRSGLLFIFSSKGKNTKVVPVYKIGDTIHSDLPFLPIGLIEQPYSWPLEYLRTHTQTPHTLSLQPHCSVKATGHTESTLPLLWPLRHAVLHRPPCATSHRPSRLSGPRAACSGRRGRRHGGPHQLQVRLCDAVVPAQVDLEVVPGGVHLGAQPAGRVAGVQRLVVGQGGGAREALAADGAEDASATGTACRHTACPHGVSTHRRTGVSNNHRPTVGSSSAPTDHRSGASDRTRHRARLERGKS